jgi:hypothetical protein
VNTDPKKIEAAVLRWSRLWWKKFQREKAQGKKDTAPMAKSARTICAKRGWIYEDSTIGEETYQVRDLFRDPPKPTQPTHEIEP